MGLFTTIASNIWAVILVILFFGGSIFVHELGHFLAARRRGLKIDRFSIGFGPKIFSWVRGGVEYRVSWLPLGGYVALPQLADMRAIEGEASTDEKPLPPISYTDKMIVSVMGAIFNLFFAFALACVVMVIGQWTSAEQVSTQIGYVLPTIQVSDNQKVPSPASEAGLQVGDTIEAVDGTRVHDFDDLKHTLVTSAQWTADGRRRNILTIDRDGKTLEVTVYPQLAGDEKMRQIGIAPAYTPVVGPVPPDSIVARLGLHKDDAILSADGQPILHYLTLVDILRAHPDQPVALKVRRGTGHPQTLTITVPPRPDAKEPAELAMFVGPDVTLTHPGPVEQFSSVMVATIRTLGSIINPRSDIKLSDLSGPLDIIRYYYQAARADIRWVLWFTILVNINLAVFNLLPIPVLDGGHMLFATIAKIRGRALPPNLLATTQSVFMLLLLSMMIYVSYFNVLRWNRDSTPDEQTEEQVQI